MDFPTDFSEKDQLTCHSSARICRLTPHLVALLYFRNKSFRTSLRLGESIDIPAWRQCQRHIISTCHRHSIISLTWVNTYDDLTARPSPGNHPKIKTYSWFMNHTILPRNFIMSCLHMSATSGVALWQTSSLSPSCCCWEKKDILRLRFPPRHRMHQSSLDQLLFIQRFNITLDCKKSMKIKQT